jgi:hypothetical protein
VRAGWRCLLVIVGCWGCAGDLEDPERFDFLLDGATMMNAQGEIPKPPECMTTLLAANCSTSTACHGAGALQIDLVSAGVETRLVDKSSTSELCKSAANNVYVPTNGSPSLLLQKLEARPPCGLRMPIGMPLEDADVMCISAWVEAVADASGGS